MINELQILFLFIGTATAWCVLLAISKKYLKSLLSQDEVNNFKVLYPISIGFSFLGLTIGVFSGLSMSPVVGTIVPAFLTFLGGFITYFFTKETGSHINRLIAIICLIIVPPSLILGGLSGAKERKKYEETIELRALAKEKALKGYDYYYKQEFLLLEKSLKNPEVDTISFEELMEEE